MASRQLVQAHQPPSDGLQFFGHDEIEGGTGIIYVVLHDLTTRSTRLICRPNG